jgi:hypothetical protein
MYLRGDISILVPAIFRTIVAILTAPAVYVYIHISLYIYLYCISIYLLFPTEEISGMLMSSVVVNVRMCGWEGGET